MHSVHGLERRIDELQAELATLKTAAGARGRSKRTGVGREGSKHNLLRLGAVAAVLLAALGANAVYASIPDSNGVIHACYHVNGQGQVDGGAQLRLIDPALTSKDGHPPDGAACKKDEQAISWNQTGPAGPAGLTWQGAWSSTKSYAKNDAVFDLNNGSAWIALQPNTASEPSSTNAKWSLLAQKGNQGQQGQTGPAGLTWQGAWSSTKSYAKNDAVFDLNNGSAWIALQSNTGSEPSSTNSNWSLLAAQGGQGPKGATGLNWQGAWSSTTAYNTNDAVFDPNNGSAWIALQPNTGSEPSSTSSNWSLLAAQGGQGPKGPAGLNWQGAWSPTTAYNTNDAVFDPNNGSAWIALQSNTGSEPSSTSSNWSLLAARGAQGNPGKDAPARITGYIDPRNNPATIIMSDASCTATYVPNPTGPNPPPPYWDVSCPAGTFAGAAVPFVETYTGDVDLNSWGSGGDGSFDMHVVPTSASEVFWFHIDSLSS